MNTLYALPGFMPPAQPKAAQTIRTEMEHGLDLVFFTEDNLGPARNVVWSVRIQGLSWTGRSEENQHVVLDEDSDIRVYRLTLPPNALPPGTHVFEFTLGGEPAVPFVRMFVTVAGQLPNTWNRHVAVGRGEAIEAMGTVRLYHSETGAVYYLGVTGPGQLTLTEG